MRTLHYEIGVTIGLFLVACSMSCAAANDTAANNATADDATKKEKGKIESLIKQVEGLEGAKFIRNDTEYDAKSAGRFLRAKLERASDVKTAKEFIEKIASKSSTSGKPYRIKFNDGKEVNSGDYLTGELKKLEKPEKPK